MAKKINSEDKLIEKIDKFNKKTEEINKEPIKKDIKKTIKSISKKVIKKVKKEMPIKEDAKKSFFKKEKVIKDNNIISNLQPKTKFGVFEAVVVLVNVALIFCLIGYLVGTKLKTTEEEEYTTANKEIQTFIDQYNYILQNYYGEVDENKLITNAINGMLTSLDDYSGVIDSSSNAFTISLEGSYKGIGVSITSNSSGQIVVSSIYEDTPASRAGIKVGDILTYFNEMSLLNVSTSDFVAKVGQNEKMTLTLLRDGVEQKVTLSREQISLKSVDYKMLDGNVGYIYVSLFANNTYDQFKTALESLENQGMKSLIIDLRNNSGGHLTAVESMLSLFVDSKHVIYQTEDASGASKVYSNGKINKEYKIVVLQNGQSASASEIMSASLRENLSAYIIGNKSFGKGTVQELQTAGDIQYKFTTKKWLTPNGNWINKVGVIPDLEVSLSKEHTANPTLENDTQYQAALNYLK